ncbi:hypothetical protein C8J56DRAFT_1026412 [Mycena floridula]|nr:hypothetical protein C8J56DRAFT_1026412 [Mycena floridula]
MSTQTTDRTDAAIQSCIDLFPNIELSSFPPPDLWPTLDTIHALARQEEPPEPDKTQYLRFHERALTWHAEADTEHGYSAYIRDSAGLGAAVTLLNIFLGLTEYNFFIVSCDIPGGGESDLRIIVVDDREKHYVLMGIKFKRCKVFQTELETLVARLQNGPVMLNSLTPKEMKVWTEVVQQTATARVHLEKNKAAAGRPFAMLCTETSFVFVQCENKVIRISNVHPWNPDDPAERRESVYQITRFLSAIIEDYMRPEQTNDSQSVMANITIPFVPGVVNSLLGRFTLPHRLLLPSGLYDTLVPVVPPSAAHLWPADIEVSVSLALRAERTGQCQVGRFGKFMLKLDEDKEEERLLKEAEAYRCLPLLQGDAIPRFLGLFHWGSGRLLIVSWVEGRSIHSFDELSQPQRLALLDILVKIHDRGVIHGDLAPRNVMVTETGQVRVIDFDHAELDHQCPGVSACEELLDIANELGVEWEPAMGPLWWLCLRALLFLLVLLAGFMR